MDEKSLFEDSYGQYMPAFENIQAIMLSRIDMITKGADSETTLIEHVKSRIKDPESLKTKLVQSGYEISVESGLLNLSDIIGVRVVTHFIGDIYDLVEQIKQEKSWQVVAIKDYIASPKPNGYRSLHVVVAMPFGYGGFGTIRTEIQLRTIAMDCWASLEHQLKYKKDIDNTDLIVNELKRCADEMASTDLSMQTIRDLIQKRG